MPCLQAVRSTIDASFILQVGLIPTNNKHSRTSWCTPRYSIPEQYRTLDGPFYLVFFMLIMPRLHSCGMLRRTFTIWWLPEHPADCREGAPCARLAIVEMVWHWSIGLCNVHVKIDVIKSELHFLHHRCSLTSSCHTSRITFLPVCVPSCSRPVLSCCVVWSECSRLMKNFARCLCISYFHNSFHIQDYFDFTLQVEDCFQFDTKQRASSQNASSLSQKQWLWDRDGWRGQNKTQVYSRMRRLGLPSGPIFGWVTTR